MEARSHAGWDRASAKALRTLSSVSVCLHRPTLGFLCHTRILSQVPGPHPQVTQQAGLADPALCSPIQATEARPWGMWTEGVCEQQGGRGGGGEELGSPQDPHSPDTPPPPSAHQSAKALLTVESITAEIPSPGCSFITPDLHFCILM